MIKGNETICFYLPTDEMSQHRMPDRGFFWKVAFTALATWADQYYQMVVELRFRPKTHADDPKIIIVNPEWEERLMRHAHQGRSKMGQQRVTLERAVRPYKPRE